MLKKCSTSIILTLLLIITITELAQAQLAGYSYRKKLTVDNSQVSTVSNTDLTNFPVLISLTDTDLATSSGYVTSVNGFDIAFTSSDGITKLDHELEEYTSGTGQILAWVRFPTLNATTDTDFYIYFGNSSQTTDQSVASTWDSNFQLVLHMDDLDDATSNNNNGTNNGTSSTTGILGNARSFSAAGDDFISVADDATLDITGPITLSAWINIDNYGTTPDLITKGDYNESYGTWLRSDNTARFADDGTTLVTSTATIASGTTGYVTFTNSGTESAVYINGSNKVTGSVATFTNNNDLLYISTTAYPLNGWVDEVRVSNVARSDDWIITEYNNQFAPGSFYSETDEPPVLANVEIAEASAPAGGAAIPISESITLTTPFVDSIESATIQITGNLDSSEDILAFSNTALITGSYTAGTGTMTLTGRASVADYQTALRNITYQNTDGSTPNQATRTISFTVEGLFSYTSNTVTRDLNITTVLTGLTDLSNIVFNFDAQDADGDGNSLTNQPADGALASWIDVAGNVTATATSPDIPTLSASYFGERGGILFDYNSGDNGDHYPLSEPANLNGTTYTEKSFAAVFRTTENLSGLQIVYEQGGQSNGYLIGIKDSRAYASAWSVNAEWNGIDGDHQTVDLGPIEANTSYIIIANHDQSRLAWEASINGGEIISSPGNAGTMNAHSGDPNIGEEDNTIDPVTFEDNPATTNNFDGYIAELASWNTALTSGQITSIYNFLCNKWCNTPSVLSSIEGTNLDYSEGDSPSAITSSLSISDIDNTILDSAKVTISSNFQTSEDQLAFVDAGGITGSWNATTGVLSLSGNATLAQYQTALQSITYENTNTVNPNTSIRQIDFIVYDWDDESNVESRNVNVIAVNSSPTLSGITGGTLTYTEGDGAVDIISAITITDVDDTNIEGATIEITGNYISGEDELGFTDAAGITGSWNPITGVLTLSGSATLAQYETALQSVTFENLSSDPVPLNRTVSFLVNDGDNNSNTQSRDISITPVNSPPILSNLEGTDLTYPQEAINITNTIEISDPDDTTIDSARVIITGNFQSDEDSLFYSTLFGITGNYDETTGILALSGNASFSDYQTALRSIEYFNYSAIPTGPERVVSFLAYDEEDAESDTLKRIIEVSSVESVSGLEVWLRSDTGVDTTAGGEVITWEDQSGNGNDFLGVAGSGTRPTFSLTNTELGGESAISFIGNGDHFSDTDGHTNYINAAGGMDEFTLFVVYKSDEINSDQGLWIAETPAGDDKTFTIRYDASGANSGGSFTNVVKTGILGNGAANQLESFSDIQSNTAAQIVSLHWESSTTYDLYVDGILNNPSSAGSPPVGNITTATTALVGKGGKDTGNNSWNGLIAEVILYSKNLSEAERQNVEDYLAVKYSSAIRKITSATGGESISADDANSSFTSLTGPVIQEGFPGELTNSGTIVLTAPSGYKWNTGATPDVSEEAVYGGSTNLAASFTSFSADSSAATFTVSTASTASNPGQLIFSGLEVRPNTGTLPNTGFITNTGTTGQGGGTDYGTLTMVAGAVDSLIYTQQPTITNINSAIDPSVRVQLVDQFGNSVKSNGIDISVALNSGTGSLTGTSPVASNALGIASFDDLEIDNVGSKTLIATSSGLDSKVSDAFDIVNAGVLTGFTVERVPSGNISSKTAGQTFDILITAVDGTSTTVTTFSGTVAVTSSCTIGTGNGTTASFSSGVLSGHTVSITSIGNCSITVTNSSGSETGVSNTFIVSAGAADVTTSTISASPTTILNDGISTSAITVQLKDAFGNNRATSGGTVALSATDGSLSAVSDNTDGTYSATLTSSTSTVTSTITGTLDAISISNDTEVEFASFSHIWTSQLGSTSDASNWDDTDNWNVGTVPNSSSVVLIPVAPSDGNEFPVIDVNNTTIQDLTLEPNAQVTVSGSITFIVTGDISGDGDILGSNNDILTVGGNLDVAEISLGTVIFDGSSEQTIISPHSYVNLEIDNSTIVNVTSDLTVTGTLTLTDGELFIPNGINLLANTQSYGSGELRFQREITGSLGWRMLSSPVSSTYGDFLDGIVTQGYSGAFYSTGSNPGDTLQPNILTYLENYEGTDNQRYRAPTSSAQNLTEGQGIWAFIFGDIAADSRYNDPLPDTLDVSGQKFDGDGTEVDFGITYTVNADSGWNFIGNPFGAAIDWDDNANWTKTNVESTIYIWDPAANGGNGEYLTWNGTTGTLGSGLIAPFQGFWVKANDENPTLIVDKEAKTTGGNFLRKERSQTSPVIELTASINGLSKRTNLMFSEDGQKNRDHKDGLRLIPFSTSHVEFYSLLPDGEQLAINNLPLNFTNRIKIPLVLNAFENGQAISGQFDISMNGQKAVPADWLISLIDNSTGEKIDLLDQGKLKIDHTTRGKLVSNSSPASPSYVHKAKSNSQSGRFTLQISTEEIEANIPEKFYLNQNYPNPFNPSTTIQYGLTEAGPVNLTVYDILGRKVSTLVNTTQFEGNYSIRFDASQFASGIYIYHLVTNEGAKTKKLTFIK